MAIDIPSLFRDVIETPEQRQRRKLSEAVALAPQARGGIASLLNPLVQATSVNLQQGSEGLGRSVGGMLGLDMRDTGEKVSDQLLGADLSSSTGMRDLSRAISQYAPVQAMGLLQAADEKDLQEAQLERDLEDRRQLRTLREQNIAANTRSVELERQNKAARERIAENLREEGEVSENLIDSYVRGVTTLGQIEDSIRAGKADDIAAAREKRAVESHQWNMDDRANVRERFDRETLRFNQEQRDRERDEAERLANIAAATTFKTDLLKTIRDQDEDNVYVGVLSSDANIPLSSLRAIKSDFEQGIEPNVTVQTLYDSENDKNIIASIDRDTGELISILGEPARSPATEKNITVMSTTRAADIDTVVRKQNWADLKDLKLNIDGQERIRKDEEGIWGLVGQGNRKSGEILLRDMIHSYSERNNVSLAETIQVINEQLQTNNGRNLLSIGFIRRDMPSSEIDPEALELIETYTKT